MHPALSFLSTPSVRRATQTVAVLDKMLHISIHALREEGDGTFWAANERLKAFLSTPSVRRATSPVPGSDHPDDISIHALREEGDQLPGVYTGSGVRKISIHALREEGDRPCSR